MPFSQIPAPTRPVQQADLKQRPKTGPGGLYVAGPGSILEYTLPDRKNLGPRCSDAVPLSGGVNGIAVDAHRILYVPYNSNLVHHVATFGPDCGAPGPELVDQSDIADVAVDNRKGTVYVSSANTGNIDVFDKGATRPSRTLHNAQHGGSGFGVAVDSHGNVFNSGSSIVEFPHGRNKGSKALTLSGLKDPLGITFDRNDDLIVANASKNVTIYAPPYNGAPKQTIATPRYPLYCGLDKRNKHLYVSEQKNNAIDVFAYPSGTYEYSITGNAGGVALDPPSPN